MTAYDLPLNPPATRTLSPVVAVLGRPGRIAALPAHLPGGWSLREARDLDDVRPGELVLFVQPTERDVVTARAVLPHRSRIVVMVDERAPAELVAAVLTAGADACVRGGHPAILAGHLVACRRRMLADRWADLQIAAGSPAE
ncbi:MAG TPA: hypothetical protein VFR35_15735 [Actinoplanes sp.]|nr:hypothetical protein [Actinoplanes sp.]